MSNPANLGKQWRRRVSHALALLLLVWLGSARDAPAAGDLPAPTGPVLLVVSGTLDRSNRDGTAAFDQAMLEGLGLRKLRTQTVWTKGVKEFEGVLVRDVFAAIGAKGGEVRAVARNDYSVTIPMADFQRYDVLLALRMDGVNLKPRDKGPLWIVYPRDQHRELRDVAIDSRWVWQLRQLEVK